MHFLSQLVLIVTAATFIVALSHRFRLPSLLGFLFTGLLLGPVGFGVVSDSHAIELMAEIGVVLLMFTIGLEVSISDLARLATRVLGGGTIQLTMTTLLVAGVLYLSGVEPNKALVGGLLLAASSTALVLRLLGERGELGSPYGQLSLAILLMQDFAVVGLMLLLPLAAGQGASALGIIISLGKAGGLAVGIFFAARFLLPWLLRHLVVLRSREVFLLATLAAVFGTAWIAHAVGLSLALGAFIAGLVISESEFSHQMFAEVLPFRDVFNGLFFVSVGLLLQRELLVANPGLLLLMIFGALLIKAMIIFPIGLLFKLSWRHALLTGIALSQVGEFALVLAQQASSLKLITPREHGLFIATSVATMTISPLVLMASGALRKAAARGDEPFEALSHELKDHVILVGYGINGRNVARALRQLGVDYVVVEMNRVTVIQERANGENIVFGDATRHSLLHHLHIDHARALVCSIADAAATREIISSAHHANDKLMLIARTRFVAEIQPLRELGATHVVPEEFETSLELVARVLASYGSPEHTIEREKAHLRRAHYEALVGVSGSPTPGPTLIELLGELSLIHHRLESSAAVGQTLAQLDLRARTEVTIIAVLRQDQTLSAPGADLRIEAGDVLVLAGTSQAVQEAIAQLD